MSIPFNKLPRSKPSTNVENDAKTIKRRTTVTYFDLAWCVMMIFEFKNYPGNSNILKVQFKPNISSNNFWNNLCAYFIYKIWSFWFILVYQTTLFTHQFWKFWKIIKNALPTSAQPYMAWLETVSVMLFLSCNFLFYMKHLPIVPFRYFFYCMPGYDIMEKNTRPCS